jgi:hypothetical protein
MLFITTEPLALARPECGTLAEAFASFVKCGILVLRDRV